MSYYTQFLSKDNWLGSETHSVQLLAPSGHICMAVHCFIDIFTRHELLTVFFPWIALALLFYFWAPARGSEDFLYVRVENPTIILRPENESTDPWYKCLDLPLLNLLRWPCKVLSSCFQSYTLGWKVQSHAGIPSKRSSSLILSDVNIFFKKNPNIFFIVW